MRLYPTLKHGKQVYVVDLRPHAGRRFFPKKVDAEVFLKARRTEAENLGTKALGLSHEERLEMLRAKEQLAAVGATISQAVAFYVERHKGVNPLSLGQAMELFLIAKEQAGRRATTLHSLEISLSLFVRGRESELVGNVAAADLKEWLANPKWAMATRRTKLIDLRSFFTWAVKEGHATHNPAAGVEAPLLEVKPPVILTVDEARRLLLTTQTADPDLLPAVAIGLFCGLRPSEIQRLTWRDIQLEERLIHVHGPVKTRRRRWVEIPENCVAWLRLGGALPPADWKRNWALVRKAAGFERWTNDAMRHSFCSYALPVHGAARTAREAGHTEDVLFASYRNLVKPKEAERWWKILPG